ncbi:N-6 DNA methylase [Mesorhizobium sp. B2-1-3A]|uniref:HsdM family class I SAM-dependent methyltransferase n=1 Tax=Mesorhizobium sp. B2-1-3A TaxID=2589971 RepID=UPI00112D69BB|nr:N-6 DNA methylase [Mesorhizobium sp. B2-1-3A]TPM94691.1 SAM-dependent methyltransferase [Mesorhizobium sp. B2-1-3A]
MFAADRTAQRKRKLSAAAVADVPLSLDVCRAMARGWSEQLDGRKRLPAIWAFVAATVQAYIEASGRQPSTIPTAANLSVAVTYKLDAAAAGLAHTLGRAAADLPIESAAFQLSACYTAMLPQDLRSAWGAFYTPPALTQRLMDLATEAGVYWQTARVLDPACGGGAFLLPVALKMQGELAHLPATKLLGHFAKHLAGFEIDPFAAQLTQTWLEIAFSEVVADAGTAFPTVVRVCDSLQEPVSGKRFDLVIGNPPYGRQKVGPELRQRFARSLYGHANLYGMFTDLALQWAREGGVVAYLTPTGFLAGEYFKALRSLLAKDAPPIAIDFITERRGVFDDVLQETLLAAYRRGGVAQNPSVHYLSVNGTAAVTHAGTFALPADRAAPWMAPRTPTDMALVDALEKLPARLVDWGYQVSTGPLVWNRFKDQFRTKSSRDTLPVIWAEAVTADGRFIFRAEKRNHAPYFKPRACDEWLTVSAPCVLLQRTTSKEQARRLIAAELPASFIASHGGVIVENHLNMVKPTGPRPKVSPALVAAVLNSQIADRAFRCISGSVAVSAFELEALPLPVAEKLAPIATLIDRGADRATLDQNIESIFLEGK